jgi:hypothetical protein
MLVCRTILRDIALNALGVRPEELCQDKARNLYIISDSLRGYSKLSSERYVYLKEKGQRRSVLSIPYHLSTQNI